MVANLTLVLLLGTSLWSWTLCLPRLLRGQTLVAWQPRWPVPWGLGHLALAVILLMLCQSLALELLGWATGLDTRGESSSLATADPAAQVQLLLTMSLANVAWLAGMILVLRATGGAWAESAGMGLSQFGADVALGFVAFVLVAPLVYGLQFVLVQWWPSEHPAVAIVRQSPTAFTLSAVALSAVLVAPAFEEYAFRLLLQGWLENAATVFAGGRISPTTGGADAPAPSAPRVDASRILLFGWPRSPRPEPDASSPALATERSAFADEAPLMPPSDALAAAGWLYRAGPILVSAAIFAALHVSHGPDWIPLFLLALVLGYLYQRTQRITASIVVHLLLNGISFLVLLAEVGGKG